MSDELRSRIEALHAKIAELRVSDGWANGDWDVLADQIDEMDAERRRLERILAEPAADRNKDLRDIHVAKRDLGLDDATYRDILWTFGRTRTAAELDGYARREVIRHLKSRGWRPRPRRRKFISPRITLPEDRARMGRKICAMLAARDADHPYADAMAQRMGGVTTWEFLSADDLHKLVAALEIDQRRHAEAKV